MPENPSPADVRSVEQAYKKWGRELWCLFYAQCCDPHQARDALQEAFLRLQEHGTASIGNLRGWLLRVGRNWLRDMARREKRSAPPSGAMGHVIDGHAPSGPYRIAEGREVSLLVRRGLQRLRPGDREVLVLRYAMDWSSHRIAETLGSTSTAVDMRLSRARRRLAEFLQQMGVGHEPERQRVRI